MQVNLLTPCKSAHAVYDPFFHQVLSTTSSNDMNKMYNGNILNQNFSFSPILKFIHEETNCKTMSIRAELDLTITETLSLPHSVGKAMPVKHCCDKF